MVSIDLSIKDTLIEGIDYTIPSYLDIMDGVESIYESYLYEADIKTAIYKACNNYTYIDAGIESIGGSIYKFIKDIIKGLYNKLKKLVLFIFDIFKKVVNAIKNLFTNNSSSKGSFSSNVAAAKEEAIKDINEIYEDIRNSPDKTSRVNILAEVQFKRIKRILKNYPTFFLIDKINHEGINIDFSKIYTEGIDDRIILSYIDTLTILNLELFKYFNNSPNDTINIRTLDEAMSLLKKNIDALIDELNNVSTKGQLLEHELGMGGGTRTLFDNAYSIIEDILNSYSININKKNNFYGIKFNNDFLDKAIKKDTDDYTYKYILVNISRNKIDLLETRYMKNKAYETFRKDAENFMEEIETDVDMTIIDYIDKYVNILQQLLKITESKVITINVDSIYDDSKINEFIDKIKIDDNGIYEIDNVEEYQDVLLDRLSIVDSSSVNIIKDVSNKLRILDRYKDNLLRETKEINKKIEELAVNIESSEIIQKEGKKEARNIKNKMATVISKLAGVITEIDNKLIMPVRDYSLVYKDSMLTIRNELIIEHKKDVINMANLYTSYIFYIVILHYNARNINNIA